MIVPDIFLLKSLSGEAFTIIVSFSWQWFDNFLIVSPTVYITNKVQFSSIVSIVHKLLLWFSSIVVGSLDYSRMEPTWFSNSISIGWAWTRQRYLGWWHFEGDQTLVFFEFDCLQMWTVMLWGDAFEVILYTNSKKWHLGHLHVP